MAPVTEEVWTKADFVDLARRQKQFLGIILLVLAVNVVAVLAPPAQQSLVRGVTMLLSLLSLYFVYKLVTAVLPPSSTWIIIAYFGFSLIPFVGLLVLAYLNILATRRLRLTGVRAGYLGANISDLQKLREDYTVTVTA